MLTCPLYCQLPWRLSSSSCGHNGVFRRAGDAEARSAAGQAIDSTGGTGRPRALLALGKTKATSCLYETQASPSPARIHRRLIEMLATRSPGALHEAAGPRARVAIRVARPVAGSRRGSAQRCNAIVPGPMPTEVDAVVIGAGLAGLSAANELQKKNVGKVLLLESSDAPGGRVRSDVVDGFILDRCVEDEDAIGGSKVQTARSRATGPCMSAALSAITPGVVPAPRMRMVATP